jgi:hypothetical protein
MKRDDIYIDEVGKFSLSHTSQFSSIFTHILKKAGIAKNQKLEILDGMAGVGGDSSCLMFFFPNSHLISNELNLTRFLSLQHNIQKIKGDTNLETATVTFRNADVLDVLIKRPTKNKQFDIIYLDPPWGGVNYKTHPHKLLISGIDLVTCCQKAFENYDRLRLIIVKLPRNFLAVQSNALLAIPSTTVITIPVKMYSYHVYDIFAILKD